MKKIVYLFAAGAIAFASCKKATDPSPTSTTAGTASADSASSLSKKHKTTGSGGTTTTGSGSTGSTTTGSSTGTTTTATSLGTFAKVAVYKSGTTFYYTTGMTIDADGAYKAYNKNDAIALDYLSDGGVPGDWWALATDANGNPIIQGATDPAPGYYVSMTSLADESVSQNSPYAYVDAASIPYIVLPPNLEKAGGAKLGDFVAVYNAANGKVSYAIFADEGPNNHLGEGSIALANNLTINSSAKTGGADSGIHYVIFPGSGNGKKRTAADIATNGQALFTAWGGVNKLLGK